MLIQLVAIPCMRRDKINKTRISLLLFLLVHRYSSVDRVRHLLLPRRMEDDASWFQE